MEDWNRLHFGLASLPRDLNFGFCGKGLEIFMEAEKHVELGPLNQHVVAGLIGIIF